VHDLDHVGGGKDEVVAGGSSLELRVHALVRIEGIDHDVAAMLLSNFSDHLGADVIGPGVEMQGVSPNAQEANQEAEAAREPTSCDSGDAKQWNGLS
jgi:hypothetical protein